MWISRRVERAIRQPLTGVSKFSKVNLFSNRLPHSNAQVFIFEFKVVELEPEGYADKYRSRGEPIHLIGVEISKTSRNVVGFEVETRSFTGNA